MNKSPAFQFYPDKFQAGTGHLSAESYRAYHRTMCWMWLHSPNQHTMQDTTTAWKKATLIDDPDKLATVRAEIMDEEMPLFSVRKRDKKLVSKGLKKEHDKQKTRRTQTQEAAKLRWAKHLKAMRLQSERNPQTMQTVCPTAPTPSVVPSPTPTTKPLTAKSTRARFVPPTLEQVKERIMDKGYGVDADKFWNHYESNGWKVGRNPMKKWEAALAKWNSESGTQSAAAPTQPRKPDAATEASFAEVNRVLASQARREGRA